MKVSAHVRILVGVVALGVVSGAALVAAHVGPREMPQSLQVTGYTGRLGEWELTATLARAGDEHGELTGPMTMRHVGICTVEGPEEKTGAMRVRLSSWSSKVVAHLTIDGVECLYRGPLSDSGERELTCPDRRPSPITLWAKD
jgi:hypothetical protein